MKTLLWLDDIRNPFENSWLVFSPIEQPFDVIWVKSYNEFTKWIKKNGLPTAICFDHDLGNTATGYDAALFLTYYCQASREKLPLYNIQSANPVGKENIRSLLENYKKHVESK
jgi:hypothetical protein